MDYTNIDFSDEEDEEVTWSKASLYHLRFGKHKGTPLGELVLTSESRSYLRWCLEWTELKEEAKVNIECCLSTYEELKSLKEPRKRKRTNGPVRLGS
jgi:hypothetical protein